MRGRSVPLALGVAAVFAVGSTSCSSSGGGGGGGGGGPTQPPAGKALLRFVHAVADARAFDFYAENSKAISGLVFLKGTSYIVEDTSSAAPIQVTPKGDSTHVLINTTVTITPNHTFTFYAVGPAANITTLFTSDSNTAPVTTAIKLRFVNVAPSGGALDVYASAVGDTLPTTPLIGGLQFKAASVYQLLAPGSWEIRMTQAGSRTVAVDDTLNSLNNGAVRTVVVMDNLGGGLPLHAINLPDAR